MKNSVTGRNRDGEWQKYLDYANSSGGYYFYVSDHHQYGKANFIRNEWMAFNAEGFFVYDPTGRSRGTQDCVKRVREVGLDIVDISHIK